MAATVLAVAVGSVPARGAAPADAPANLSPDGSTDVGPNTVFSWDAVVGATQYVVKIDDSPTFASPAYSATTYNTSATPTTDLPLGTLYWRVSAKNSSGEGPPSDVVTFTRVWQAAPEQIAPPDGDILTYPTEQLILRWNPLAGAKSYKAELDDATDFIDPAQCTTSNLGCTYTEPLTPGQTYYWRVRAVASQDAVVSEWSDIRSLTIEWPDTPTPLSPVGGTTVEDVEFAWDPLPGAAKYDLQYSPNADFTNNTVTQTSIKGTRYSPPSGLDNDTYFWRVRAKDSASIPHVGSWSDAATFTRAWSDIPTLLTPVDGDFDVSDPTLSWTPVDHAGYYEIWLGIDENFSPNTYDTCFTNRTTWVHYLLESGTDPDPGSCQIGVPEPGQQYFWKVRGIDKPALINGEWSAVSSFIFKEDIPALVSPADAAEVSAPVLTWGPVDGAEKYKVTILKSDASTVAHTKTTYALSYTPTVELDPADGPFYWYVTTVDHAGADGLIPNSGSWRTFSIVDPSSTFASPTPTAPADASSSLHMPSMQWQPVTGAATYTIYHGVAGSGVESVLASSLPYAAYTHTSVLANGDYFWYVRAYDGDNVEIANSFAAQRTFTIEEPVTATYTSPADCTVVSSCEVLYDTPTLDWEPVEGAGVYRVHFSIDSAFTNVRAVFETQYTSLSARGSFLDSQAGQAWYWFVQPCKSITRCGKFDSSVFPTAFAFRKASAPVELLTPADGATVSNLTTFTWRDYLATNGELEPPVDQEAEKYRIQVSTQADFSTLLEQVTVDQTTYTPYAETYPEGPLYWRVQGIDASGNFLTFSETRTLTKSSPAVVLSLPADEATVTDVPYFTWEPQAYAAKYDIELYKNGDTLFSPANKLTTTGTSKTGVKLAAHVPTVPIAPGEYAWRVRRQDADGLPGPWSAGRTFTLSYGAVNLVSPANGATFTSNDLVFTWTAVAGATQYAFEASTTNFGALYENVTSTVMTSWAPTKKYADGTFYWRVKAKDAAGNVLSTSLVRSFSHDVSLPTVTSKTPTSNAPVTGNFSVVFSEPVTNVTASTFTMKIAGTATAVPGTVTTGGGGTTATFNPSPTLMPGQSYTLSLSSAITDLSGNSLTPFSWTVRTALLVDQTSPAVRELWDADAASAANGGSYHASKTAGARATYRFTGTNVSLLGRRAPDGGYADLYLDGVRVKASQTFYSAATSFGTIYTKSGLVNTTHTFEVRVLGTKPSSSSDRWVYVDGFKVGSIVVQESSGAVLERFNRVSSSSSSGGSYDLVSHTKLGDNGSRPYVQLSFKGTKIAVFGTKGPSYGKASVYIDGVRRATVDLYATSTQFNRSLFTSTTLSNAVHTIRVYVDGTRNASSSGYNVGFDRLQIT